MCAIDIDPLAEPAGYGVKVDQTPRPNWLGHDKHTKCDIVRNDVQCPNDRTRILWIGCLNEHLGPICVCSSHPDMANVIGVLKCELCQRGGEYQLMRLIKEEPAP